MATGEILSKHILRDRFAVAMSGMYCEEIPAYAALVEMVAKQNIKARSQHSHQNKFPEVEAGLAYHGAIRLGSIEDLRMMRRAFAIMGMQPVGYYDLSAAGVPVHSTAFRPISSEAMEISPFRVFTSLLRLDMIEGEDLKQRIKHLLSMREVFTPQVVELIEIAETQGGLSDIQADKFVVELLETFRWKKDATVSLEEYKFFNQSNRLLADIVSFHGPHINHLTVGAEDIDEAHKAIVTCGVQPKSSIEGPPYRKCPILLRQTAFKAIEDLVLFPDGCGSHERGSHLARFGEIEARGAALTPKGRALYDRLLAEAQARKDTAPQALQRAFENFPDDWDELRKRGLVYFQYRLTPRAMECSHLNRSACGVDQLIETGLIDALPVRYEDFLPVSAAGIFRSNLGEEDTVYAAGDSRKLEFEACLDTPVLDMFDLYKAIETNSLSRCIHSLSAKVRQSA